MKIVTVGRKEDNDVVIGSDPFVGRHHCQFVEKNGQYFVVDLDSTNGTFVNSKRITGQYCLEDSDVVRIGNTVLTWKRYFNKEHFKTQLPDAELPVIDLSTPRPPVVAAEQTGPQTPTPILEPTPEETPASGEALAPRHGFITFWLWMSIVSGFIGGFVNIFFHSDEYYLYSAGGSTYIDESVFIILGLISWGGIVGSVAMLRRKKWGFYMFLGLSVLSCWVTLFALPFDIGFIGLLGSALLAWILWLILHIKKEGVKYWDTMA